MFIDVLQWRAPVVTFQMLGNRWSLERDSTPENYSLELETHAAFKAIRDAGVTGPLDLVGHSVGGALALNFALDHPEHVRSLTLIEPTAPWVIQPHSANISQFIQERIDSYQGQITPERYGAFLRKAMGPKYEPGRSRFWPSMCLYRNNMNYRPAFYNHSDDPCRLEATRFPVLLIAGSESLPFHHEIVEGLQNKLPKSELIVMPGNHAPHYGQGKDAFTSNLVRFLEGQS